MEDKRKCTRRGCLKEYLETENSETACQYHPGKPKFHDTKKGWDCCNKLAYDWDEFQKIPGCCTGSHTNVKEDVTFWQSQTVNNAKAGLDRAPNAPTEAPKSIEQFNKEQDEKKKAAEAAQAVPDKKPFITPNGNHKCINKGCNQEYNPEQNQDDSCKFHPGAPVGPAYPDLP